MIEQNKLLEYMQEIKEIAVSQQGRLTKEEIGKYLSGLELDSKQMEAVYQYLCASQITIEGYQYIPEETMSGREGAESHRKASRHKAAGSRKETGSRKEAGSQKGIGSRKAAGERKTPGEPMALQRKSKTRKGSTGQQNSKSLTRAQHNLRIYQREVSSLDSYNREQEMEMMKRFLSGEHTLRNEILQGHLEKVILLAQNYRKRSVPMEEMIAEGNMGLMNAISILERNGEDFLRRDGQPDMEKIHSVIAMEVKQAIETMIDGMTEQKDWEDTIVARTNLLHEAAKYLAEEMGRMATQEELSEYTKIPVQEIRDILGISEEVRKALG